MAASPTCRPRRPAWRRRWWRRPARSSASIRSDDQGRAFLMKGVLLPGNRQVLVRNFPDPAPGVGEVLVRVKASAICRSDLSLYYGDSVVEGERAGKVITGLGPMGASGIMAAKARGARAIGVDPLASRRDFARSVGADLVLGEDAAAVVPALLRATGGEGVDAAVDCSGNNAAQNAALDATRRLGRVAFIGEAREATIRPSEQLIRKQLTLMGSWYFNIAEYPEIARVIVEAEVPLDRLVTHKFSLDQAEEAFRRFDARETEKAVF